MSHKRERSAFSPKQAASMGAVLGLPFFALNAIVAKRIEPFFSMIRPEIHTSALEYYLLIGSILLLPLGALIAVRPVFPNGVRGKRKFYPINSLVALLLIVFFVLIVLGLGEELYRCDLLRIPNCD